MATLNAFLLTRDWRDTARGIQLTFWAASDSGPIKVIIPEQEAVCFVEREELRRVERTLTALGVASTAWRHRSVKLATPRGSPVSAVYFRAQRDMALFRQRTRELAPIVYESDIRPADRYLMERFITGAVTIDSDAVRKRGTHWTVTSPRLTSSDWRPTLRVLSIDVESSDLDGDLYSIALADGANDRVLMIGPPVPTTPIVPDPTVHSNDGRTDTRIDYFPNEAALLQEFLSDVARIDPDVLIGWNVVGFDLQYLIKRCQLANVDFALGRAGETATVLPGRGGQLPIARVPGRVVLDGIETLRAAFWTFEDFSLEAVGRALLGRGKLVHEDGSQIDAIRALFATDKARLAAYNLEDCQLVLDIFAHTNLVAFALERAQITGLALGRVGGSVAAFDHLYLPRLHRAGRVAPDPGAQRGEERTASPGGYVMDSEPGLYRNVLVLDFKSLYPSIIRTFQIDPYGMWAPGDDPVEGFLGAQFSRDDGILPAVMTSLWDRRDAAKRDNDSALSQAVKIIMNACYGVLASTGCRFFDPRLATSITRRGHEIIQRSQQRIEQLGHRVIYGDTDSLFVLLDDTISEADAAGRGQFLARELNEWWNQTLAEEMGLTSHLEVEFETHFLRFLMPTVRGSDTGTKKRYAGSVRTDDGGTRLVFKGLETVRTDWTPLARTFQRELYRRVFADEGYREFIEETDARLMRGELDNQLVYRKRIRRPLSEYKKNVPPHVQAARKQAKPGRWVSYIITANGPEPVENQAAVPDYEHYRARQLAPAADGILYFLETNFSEITDAQMAIF